MILSDFALANFPLEYQMRYVFSVFFSQISFLGLVGLVGLLGLVGLIVTKWCLAVFLEDLQVLVFEKRFCLILLLHNFRWDWKSVMWYLWRKFQNYHQNALRYVFKATAKHLIAHFALILKLPLWCFLFFGLTDRF